MVGDHMRILAVVCFFFVFFFFFVHAAGLETYGIVGSSET
jgi:hypothetical protein